MSTLNQKVVLVTGASGGIGAEISRQFGRTGARVIVHYAGRKEPADKVVEEIKQTGGNAIAVQADIRNPAEVRALFDKGIAEFGRIDVVVNNAGIMVAKMIKDITDEEFLNQVAINLSGAFFVLKEAMARVADNGSIIDISTSVNRMAIPTYGPYGATKSAVEHLTKVASKEVGRGIRVNAVSPGPVNTELYLKGKSPELIARQAALTPFNRIGEPGDIAPVVVFLATDEAHWISGQIIPVNGAMN
ncbi:MAG TPA: SDR family oxidoreductase [Puia sp.]|nr:SDR family oxidoreductase [Puia sp.]